jgi:hypothetical protein
MTNRENAGALPLDHSGQPSTAPVSTASFHCRSRLTTKYPHPLTPGNRRSHACFRLTLISKPFSEESSAPGRGLADGATEQAPGSAVGSLAPAGTSPSPNPRRCRAPQAPSTGPRFGGPVSSAAVPRWPCPSTRSRPRVRCPVSGVRVTVRCPRVSTHPLSNVRVWTSRCPGVGCPRVRVRVRGVCTGDFMERVGAAGSHTARRARVWPSRRIRERHAIGLSQGGFCSGLSGVAADARSGCRR